MISNKENKDLASAMNDFLTANRKLLAVSLAAIVLTVIGVIAFFVITEKLSENAVSHVERVIADLEEFKQKNGAAKDKALSTESPAAETVAPSLPPEAVAEEDNAIEKLKALSAKYSSAYSGFRANTAIAEIYFQRKNYEEALKFYEEAAKFGKSFYTAGIAFFNAGVCADEIGNYEKALEFYKKASEVKFFPFIPRAMFNMGRIYETMQKPEQAMETYNKLLSLYPRNDWALLAKSRVIEISKDKK